MNIYVGNLASDVKEEEIRTAFEEYGHVDSVKVIKDRYTGMSRGFGFVEMPIRSEALSAINGLNEKDLKGNTIKVNEAHPRPGGNRGGRHRRY